MATLDVLSGGRAWLGIGAGNYEEEARGVGIPYPPLARRFDLLEETLQVCLRLWSGDERPFQTERFRLEQPLNLPRSISRPHPPVLVAGGGEHRTLPLVARYADACNLRPGPEIPQKLDLLRRLCEREGRDFDRIEKTCVFAFDVGEGGSGVNDLVARRRWLAGMGVQTVIGRVERLGRPQTLEIIGRCVLLAVADL